MERNRGQQWIVKPSNSCQGRGIFITENREEIPDNAAMVVSHYIDNPLLINGYKFDLRVYVLITCFDPLRIYIYEEGLGRFATVKYDSVKNSKFKHLTNYSINKKNGSKRSSEEESYKWTFKMIKSELKKQGVDTELLWTRIHDIIIKSILSIESIVNSCVQMYCPTRNNCFDLFGFDILIDEQQKPWLVEINMSPSMGCDS